MRPHLLRFSGIGSYPGDVLINFDDLNRKGLYLIVGPTGAGKTTLLDAMTFALYGKVAQDRENALVSAHAGAKPPKIEFEFSQGGRRYLIHREPAPPGKQALPNKQWMKELDSGGNEIRTVTGAKQVNDLAKDTVGLSADEFMQVILLPQGKFQQFLMAKGSDKQRVLQTIFGTATYRRVVDRLNSSAAKLREQVASGKEDLGRKWAIIDANVGSLRAHDDFVDLPNHTEDLDAAVRFIETKSKELDKNEKSTREAHAQFKSDQDLAAQEADRFDKAEVLSALRTEHEAAQAAAEQAGRRLSDHGRSEPVVRAVEARDKAAAAAKELAESVSECRKQLGREAKRFAIAEALTKKLVTDISTATPGALTAELAKLKTRLETATTQHESLDVIATELESNETKQQVAQQEIASLAEALVLALDAVATSKKQLDAARDQAKGLHDAAKAVDALNELRTKADVEGATKALDKANAALAAAQKKLDKAEAAFRAAQAQRTAELAGVLASELVLGDPCPVCGSTDHPKKAKAPAGVAADVETTEAARDQARARCHDAERDLKDAQQALETANGFLAKLPTPSEQQAIEDAHKRATEASSAIDALDAAQAAAVESVDRIKDETTAANRVVEAVAAETKGLLGHQGTLRKSVDAVGSAKAVADALAVSDTIEGLLADLEEQTRELDSVRGRVAQATKAAEQELSRSGFADERAAALCGLGQDEVLALDAVVRENAERDIAIGKLAAAVGSKPLPDSRPDLGKLKADVSAADALAQAAASVAGATRTARKQIEEARKEIDRIGPEIEEKTRQAEKADSIAVVFDKGAGGPGGQLSLEVWVQRTMFEEVCLVANEQLRSLSSNRYSLTLEQEEGGVSKRRGSGLDIYVLDQHTGFTRPVQTMSGGEQFIASLSLALALAEVVQRHSGGIELPCLFIDEGFGGLDLDSLDLAIDVLGRIHAAGRTVGIITHVETMQQQLPIGIRVHKSDHGSTLEVLADS